MRRRALLGAALFGLGGAAALRAAGVQPFVVAQKEFAVAIYAGPSPLELHPTSAGPVLRAADVPGRRLRYVADPFLVRDGGGWAMFFEAFDAWTGQGDIGLARSEDGRAWRFEDIVLDEPFHLSYPRVFAWRGHHYMLPETEASGALRLYRASAFPNRWQPVGEVLRGHYSDPTLFEWDGRLWIFAGMANDSLRLFRAPEPEGPWVEHPASPVVRNDPHRARPAGPPVVDGGRLIRFAQDDAPSYGLQVRAFEVSVLTESAYEERPLGVVLSGSGSGWNGGGMHHVDAHPTGDGRWLAAVDGWRRGLSFGLRRWSSR